MHETKNRRQKNDAPDEGTLQYNNVNYACNEQTRGLKKIFVVFKFIVTTVVSNIYILLMCLKLGPKSKFVVNPVRCKRSPFN